VHITNLLTTAPSMNVISYIGYVLATAKKLFLVATWVGNKFSIFFYSQRRFKSRNGYWLS